MNKSTRITVRTIALLALICSSLAGTAGCLDRTDTIESGQLGDRYLEEWLTVEREPKFLEWFSPKLKGILLDIRNACDTSASAVSRVAENVTNQIGAPSTVGHVYKIKKHCAEWMLRLDFVPRDGEDELVSVKVESVEQESS